MTSNVAPQPLIDIEMLLKQYRSDVYIASLSFYAWKTINSFGTSEQEEPEKQAKFLTLNTNALSWTLIAYSLKITYLSALGRIFDRDIRSVGVCNFLDMCKKEITQFSKLDLEARKLKEANGVRPEWLSNLLLGAHEADLADFDELIRILRPHKQIFRRKYQPIRNKVIAHNESMQIGHKDRLFSNTDTAELEKMLEALHQVEQVVAELHLNGRKTSLTDYTLDKQRDIREDLEKLLTAIPATDPIGRDS